MAYIIALLSVVKGHQRSTWMFQCVCVCVCCKSVIKPYKNQASPFHCPMSRSFVWPGRVFMSDSIAVSCIPGQRPSVHGQRPRQLPQPSLTAALYRPLQVLDPLCPPSRVQTKPCYCLPTNKRASTFFGVCTHNNVQGRTTKRLCLRDFSVFLKEMKWKICNCLCMYKKS